MQRQYSTTNWGNNGVLMGIQWDINGVDDLNDCINNEIYCISFLINDKKSTMNNAIQYLLFKTK